MTAATIWGAFLAVVLYNIQDKVGTEALLLGIGYFVGVVVGLYLLYAVMIFTWWEKDFSGQRLERRKAACPSNKQPPDVKSFEENNKKILEHANAHEQFDSCQLIHGRKDVASVTKENTVFRKRIMRRNSMTPCHPPSQFGSIMSVEQEIGSLSKETASKLDMDHVYIPFWQYLWGLTFIGPMSMFLWWKGTMFLQIRTNLVKWGILKVKPCDIEALIGKLCLEQSQAIHFYAKSKPDNKTSNIGCLFFADFPYVDINCKPQTADIFAVDINLDTKRFVKGKLDDITLTASETLILLWFNTIAAQHVKLHALANWGLNSDTTVKEVNPFLHRNSVVTTLYNYFGYSTFHGFMEKWEKMGLLSVGWDPDAWVACVNHGIQENIWQHKNIEELVKYSEFVDFVVKVRAIFFSEFAKFKNYFPGVHGEAMFVGTVLHSLDHSLMDWNLEDPLWLDVDCPKFGKMAEIGRVVKVGFVKDVPFLYFHKRFKGSGHPFYDSVYEKAAKINKKFADNMDTCIIK